MDAKVLPDKRFINLFMLHFCVIAVNNAYNFPGAVSHFKSKTNLNIIILFIYFLESSGGRELCLDRNGPLWV